MGKGKLEKFGLAAIARVVGGLDLATARVNLSQFVGGRVDVFGKVEKVAKRDGLCRLVVQPGDVPGFIVFADCSGELETARNSKIPKGSLVGIRGKFQSLGTLAVHLVDCQLDKVELQKKKRNATNATPKKGK
jgi:hypothetical protein